MSSVGKWTTAVVASSLDVDKTPHLAIAFQTSCFFWSGSWNKTRKSAFVR